MEHIPSQQLLSLSAIAIRRHIGTLMLAIAVVFMIVYFRSENLRVWIKHHSLLMISELKYQNW